MVYVARTTELVRPRPNGPGQRGGLRKMTEIRQASARAMAALGSVPRELAVVMRPELPSLLKEMADEIVAALPEYRHLLEGPDAELVHLGIKQNVTAFVNQVAAPHANTELRDEICRSFGRFEAYQGRSLDVLQDAYRIGCQVALRHRAIVIFVLALILTGRPTWARAHALGGRCHFVVASGLVFRFGITLEIFSRWKGSVVRRSSLALALARVSVSSFVLASCDDPAHGRFVDGVCSARGASGFGFQSGTAPDYGLSVVTEIGRAHV